MERVERRRDHRGRAHGGLHRVERLEAVTGDVRDDAFVGTNVNMVAPITIGEGSYIGAGSTVTKDVPADALVVERAQPIAKDGWAARWRARHGKPRPGETKKDS